MTKILNTSAGVVSCLLLAGVLLFPAEANATGILYQFNTPFPTDPNPAGAAPWIDASFQDTGGGVLLTVTNLGITTGEFIKGMGSGANGGLFFNLDPNMSASQLTFTLIASNGNFGTSIGLGTDSFKADGDGKYDIEFDFSGQNFTANSSFTYLISGIAGLSATSFEFQSQPAGGSGPFYAAAHVQGLSVGGSTWIEPDGGPMILVVPEPSMAGLMAVCLGTWGIVRRKRKG